MFKPYTSVLDGQHEGFVDVIGNEGVEHYPTEEEGKEEANCIRTIECPFTHLKDQQKLTIVQKQGRKLIHQEDILYNVIGNKSLLK